MATTVALGVIAFPNLVSYASEEAVQPDAQGPKLKLRLLETTDLHVNLMNYDYYEDKEIHTFGFSKTVNLIEQARREAKNTLLLDNGDLLQGNPLGDYVAKIKPLQQGEIHPTYKALNLLRYDAATVGNHEFNYGLDFLETAMEGAKFPYVNANVYVDDHDTNPDNDQNYFTPYRIITKKFTDENGQEQTVRVGITGLVTPQIMQWDQAHLDGKITAKDIVETAKKVIPEMKKAGADVVVVLAHTGFDKDITKYNPENAIYPLSQVDDIDAILFGHAHVEFPSASFSGIKGVDVKKGTINGVAAVEAGSWGDKLGIIDLTLQKYKDTWIVTDSQSTNRYIYDSVNKKPLTDANKKIANLIAEEHKGTVEYVRGPVGNTTAPINSFFALVNDDPSIQIVTNAQKWYTEKALEGTKYEGKPILSVGAPFKAGGRNGVSYYTNIPAGTIAIKDTASLYIYPNTVKAVLVKGSDVKEWLEMSAGQFKQIDPAKTDEQQLINNDFPTYNYDVIDGVTYQIDVTQPAKYDSKGNVVNASANRIKSLMFEGGAIDANQEFVVVTNNYRASGGGNFPGVKAQNIILDAPDENRQALIEYIRDQKTINPSADNNWSFAPINGNVKVVFESSPQAKDFAEKLGHIKYVTTLESGFAKYQIDLAAKK